jgi:hypothetical protein
LYPKDLTRETCLRVTDSLTFTVPTESTLPFPLSPKVMYLDQQPDVGTSFAPLIDGAVAAAGVSSASGTVV